MYVGSPGRYEVGNRDMNVLSWRVACFERKFTGVDHLSEGFNFKTFVCRPLYDDNHGQGFVRQSNPVWS